MSALPSPEDEADVPVRRPGGASRPPFPPAYPQSDEEFPEVVWDDPEDDLLGSSEELGAPPVSTPQPADPPPLLASPEKPFRPAPLSKSARKRRRKQGRPTRMAAEPPPRSAASLEQVSPLIPPRGAPGASYPKPRPAPVHSHVCGDCGKGFSGKRNLNRHRASVHDLRRFFCFGFSAAGAANASAGARSTPRGSPTLQPCRSLTHRLDGRESAGRRRKLTPRMVPSSRALPPPPACPVRGPPPDTCRTPTEFSDNPAGAGSSSLSRASSHPYARSSRL